MIRATRPAPQPKRLWPLLLAGALAVAAQSVMAQGVTPTRFSKPAAAATPNLNQYGRAYLAEGDNAAAAQSYSELVRLNPFDPVALNNMAVAKAAAEDYQSAAELLTRAVRLAPHRADIRENLSNLQSWQDSYSNVALAPATSATTSARAQEPRAPALLPQPPPLWLPTHRNSPTTTAATRR
jgi:tetratricopeptide (TPR) repeat protein